MAPARLPRVDVARRGARCLTALRVAAHRVALPALALMLLATPVPGRERTASSERLRGTNPAELGYTYGVTGFRPEYTPPAPGSYVLPVVRTVTDHRVIDSSGERTTLFALKEQRVAVVAFIYTTCTEATGCPFSNGVLQRVDRDLGADPELSRRVALLTISFDPERDTPPRMATVRTFYQPQTSWRFLTTESEAALQPLLADFNQPVSKLRFADGQWSGLFRHVLKVFLVDTHNHVRNIYSVGFLNPELLLNDIRTVLMDPAAAAPSANLR